MKSRISAMLSVRRQLVLPAIVSALAVGAPGALASDVVDGGFETGQFVVDYRPSEYGVWQGDVSDIVTAENGIVPMQGQRMLEFIHTKPTGPSERKGAEMWQIVDVTSDAELIASGKAIGWGIAWFNRVEGGAVTDTQFSISINAYSGDPSSFPVQWRNSELASELTDIFTDGDPTTWEKALVKMPLPVETDFVVVHVRAWEDTRNELTGVELDGHYCDKVKFRISGQPLTVRDIRSQRFGRIGVRATGLTAGRQGTITVTNTLPGQTVHILASLRGPGELMVPGINTLINLNRPIRVTSKKSNRDGTAVANITLPLSTKGNIVWLQAIVDDNASNLVVTSIE